MDEKIKVLVVEDDLGLRQGVVEYLNEQADIQVVGEAGDGLEALRLMVEQSPDVILLDMVMQGMDGWETLRHMRERGMDCSKVIVVTAVNTEHHIMRASQYGVGSYLLKPFYQMDMLHRRILDVAHGFAEPAPDALTPPPRKAIAPQPPIADVGSALLSIGVPAHVKGFLYLREAIRLVDEDARLLGRLTGSLYPAIAQRFEATTGNVERAMRHAVELAWQRTTQEKLDAVFGPGVASVDTRPSTGELIALVINWKRTQEAREKGE